MAVTHLAVEFGLGDQRRNRIHYQHIDSAGADQGFCDFQSVLGVDEGGHSALLLRLCNYLERDRGFARRFRPEYLNHAAARKAADAQRCVKRNCSRGDHGDRDNRSLAPQLHDGAFTKLLLDLRQRQVNCPALFSFLVGHECRSLAAHFRDRMGPGEQKNMSCDGSVRQAPWNGQFAVKSAWILTAYYTSSYLEKAKK